jgi:hypothetical protein
VDDLDSTPSFPLPEPREIAEVPSAAPLRVSKASWGLRALSGLEVGVLASGIMLLWIAFGCWVQGQSFWTIPNLLAATFYGGRMLRPDFVLRTCAGLALHFAIGGMVGALYGVLRPSSWPTFTTSFMGILYGVLLYSLGTLWFWKRVNGMMAVYSTQTFILIGYVVFGVALGLIPSRLRSLERHFLVH